MKTIWEVLDAINLLPLGVTHTWEFQKLPVAINLQVGKKLKYSFFRWSGCLIFEGYDK